MNKNEIKKIIIEEIKDVLKEMASPEQLAADSRPEEDDITPPGIEDMSPDPMFGPNPSFVEEEELSEMPRTSNIFKLSQEASMKDVLQFMQRVNDVLKTFKSPGQKRPKKRFTPEEMKALATAMLNPEGFTSKDVIAATSYNSPAQANKFLKALEMKGLITLTSQLKKAQEPTRDPDAPETRGRKRRDAEFDMADDPTAMDFGDFDDLDLGSIDALEENTNTMSELEKYIKQQIRETKNSLTKLNERAPYRNPEIPVDKVLQVLQDFYVRDLTRLKQELERSSGEPTAQPRFKAKLEDMMAKLASFGGSSLEDVEARVKLKEALSEAKNPLAKKMKEIENQGRLAALETRLAAVAEMIEETEGRLTRIDEDNEFRDMMDKNAVKEVRKQLKELEKAKAKLEKEKAKLEGKGMKKKEVVDEIEDEDIPENPNDPMDHPAISEDDFALNESTLRMQKLAGLITESDIKKKLSLKEGLDPQDLRTLEVTIDSFLTQGDEGPIPKAGDVLTYDWTDDNREIQGEIPGEFITFDEDEIGKYEVKKVGEHEYEFKVTAKVDVDKL